MYLVHEWDNIVATYKPLTYSDKKKTHLLYPADKKRDKFWRTMQSMRNVDAPSNIKVFDEIGGDGSEGIEAFVMAVLMRSQSIAPLGVGSIIDLPNESIMPLSIDFWPKNMGVLIYDERLQRRLGVSYFKMIPISRRNAGRRSPLRTFVKMAFCLKRGHSNLSTFGLIDIKISIMRFLYSGM